MKNILILGFGWVAEDFAKQLLREGHQVWATTTRTEKIISLKELGIHGMVADFENLVALPLTSIKFDYVLVSIPASSKLNVIQTKLRFDNIAYFLQEVNYEKLIYLSSTGVYPDIDGTFAESDEQQLKERLVVAEDIILALKHSVVYRLGGLFGKNRIFAKYYENKVCTTGDQLANFVHVDDVVELLHLGFKHPLQANKYNIVAPLHPTKKEVILASAKKYAFQEPASWEPKDSFQKLVDSRRIIDELNYSFKYPSPLFF